MGKAIGDFELLPRLFHFLDVGGKENERDPKGRSNRLTIGIADHSQKKTIEGSTQEEPSDLTDAPSAQAQVGNSSCEPATNPPSSTEQPNKAPAVGATDAGNRLKTYPHMKMGIKELDNAPTIKALLSKIFDATTLSVDQHRQHRWQKLKKSKNNKKARKGYRQIYADHHRNSKYAYNVRRYIDAAHTRFETANIFYTTSADIHTVLVNEHKDHMNREDETYNYTISTHVFFAGQDDEGRVVEHRRLVANQNSRRDVDLCSIQEQKLLIEPLIPKVTNYMNILANDMKRYYWLMTRVSGCMCWKYCRVWITRKRIKNFTVM